MNISYAESPLVRALTGAALAAGIVTAASSASAATCTFQFPHKGSECQQGTSRAISSHFFRGPALGAALKYRVEIDMAGGTLAATAFGIDVNGNQLNRCATTAADQDPRQRITQNVPCSRIYSTSGTATPAVEYDYPLNMRSTFVTVF